MPLGDKKKKNEREPLPTGPSTAKVVQLSSGWLFFVSTHLPSVLP